MNGFVAVTAGRGCGSGTDKGSTRRGAENILGLGYEESRYVRTLSGSLSSVLSCPAGAAPLNLHEG